MDGSDIEKVRGAIQQALDQGKSLEDIRAFMKGAGYPDDEISQALASFERPLPAPEPTGPVASTSPAPRGGGSSKKVIGIIAAIIIIAILVFLLMRGGGPASGGAPPAAPGAPAIPGMPPSVPGAPTASPGETGELCDFESISKISMLQYMNRGGLDVVGAPGIGEGVAPVLEGVLGGFYADEGLQEFYFENGELVQYFVNGDEKSGSASSWAGLIELETCDALTLGAYGYDQIKGAPNDGSWYKSKPMLGGDERWVRFKEMTEDGKKYLISERRAYDTFMGMQDPVATIDYEETWMDTGFTKRSITVDTGIVDMGADNLNIDTSKSIDDWLDHPGEANITVKDFKYEFGAYVPPPTASSADFAEECDFGGVSTITNTYNDRGSYFGDYDNVGESGTTIYTLSNGEVTDVRSDSDDPQWMLENMMEVFLENTACAANILKGVYSYKLNPLISVSGFNRDNTWFHSGMRYDGNPRNGTWTRIQVSGDVTIYEERYPQRDFDGTPLGSYAVQYYEVYTATGFLKKEIAIPEIEGEVSTALPIEEMLDMASDLGYGTDEYTY